VVLGSPARSWFLVGGEDPVIPSCIMADAVTP
jgi:hypothetical protein